MHHQASTPSASKTPVALGGSPRGAGGELTGQSLGVCYKTPAEFKAHRLNHREQCRLEVWHNYLDRQEKYCRKEFKNSILKVQNHYARRLSLTDSQGHSSHRRPSLTLHPSSSVTPHCSSQSAPLRRASDIPVSGTVRAAPLMPEQALRGTAQHGRLQYRRQTYGGGELNISSPASPNRCSSCHSSPQHLSPVSPHPPHCSHPSLHSRVPLYVSQPPNSCQSPDIADQSVNDKNEPNNDVYLQTDILHHFHINKGDDSSSDRVSARGTFQQLQDTSGPECGTGFLNGQGEKRPRQSLGDSDSNLGPRYSKNMNGTLLMKRVPSPSARFQSQEKQREVPGINVEDTDSGAKNSVKKNATKRIVDKHQTQKTGNEHHTEDCASAQQMAGSHAVGCSTENASIDTVHSPRVTRLSRFYKLAAIAASLSRPMDNVPDMSDDDVRETQSSDNAQEVNVQNSTSVSSCQTQEVKTKSLDNKQEVADALNDTFLLSQSSPPTRDKDEQNSCIRQPTPAHCPQSKLTLTPANMTSHSNIKMASAILHKMKSKSSSFHQAARTVMSSSKPPVLSKSEIISKHVDLVAGNENSSAASTSPSRDCPTDFSELITQHPTKYPAGETVSIRQSSTTVNTRCCNTSVNSIGTSPMMSHSDNDVTCRSPTTSSNATITNIPPQASYSGASRHPATDSANVQEKPAVSLNPAAGRQASGQKRQPMRDPCQDERQARSTSFHQGAKPASGSIQKGRQPMRGCPQRGKQPIAASCQKGRLSVSASCHHGRQSVNVSCPQGNQHTSASCEKGRQHTSASCHQERQTMNGCRPSKSASCLNGRPLVSASCQNGKQPMNTSCLQGRLPKSASCRQGKRMMNSSCQRVTQDLSFRSDWEAGHSAVEGMVKSPALDVRVSAFLQQQSDFNSRFPATRCEVKSLEFARPDLLPKSRDRKWQRQTSVSKEKKRMIAEVMEVLGLTVTDDS